MSNTEFHSNDVNGTGAFSEGVTSSRCPVNQQCRPGHHPATAEQGQRLGWSKEESNGCLNVTSGVNERGEGTGKDC